MKTTYRLENESREMYKNFKKFKSLLKFARKVGIPENYPYKTVNRTTYVGQWFLYKNGKIGIRF